MVARYTNLVNLGKEFVGWSYMDVDNYKKYLEYLTTERSRIKLKFNNEDVLYNVHVVEGL